MATSDGIPVGFYTHAGAESAQTGRRGLPLGLPTGSQQQAARRMKSKRPHHPAQSLLIQYFRKGIDPCFRQLTARFPKQIHAVAAAGFALKIALFIFAHALHQAGL